VLLRVLSIVVVAAAGSLPAQPPCSPPAALFERPAADFFNDEREVDLGDAIVEHLARNFRMIDAPEAAAHLDRIAERLLCRLPSSHIRFRFHLIELPESNAFALPGGHIYVSRKLIAMVRDEGEIAGVVAHEMGHILAHQSSAQIAAEVRRLLKVDTAGSRQDVFALYSRLGEAYVRTGYVPRSDSGNERHQSAADRIALYSLVAAATIPKGCPARSIGSPNSTAKPVISSPMCSV